MSYILSPATPAGLSHDQWRTIALAGLTEIPETDLVPDVVRARRIRGETRTEGDPQRGYYAFAGADARWLATFEVGRRQGGYMYEEAVVNGRRVVRCHSTALGDEYFRYFAA